VHLDIRNQSGEVRIETHAAASTEVEIRALSRAAEEQAESTRVDCRSEGDGHLVLVEVPDLRGGFFGGNDGVAVLVLAPEGARLDVTVASADVRAEGRLGGGTIRSASGDVWWEEAAGDVVVTSASGDVTFGRALAALRVQTASGDIEVGSALNQLTVESQSGDIELERCEGETRLRWATGDVKVGTAVATMDVQTASGDVLVHDALSDCSVETRSGDVMVSIAHQGKVRVGTQSGDVKIGIAQGSRVAVDAETRSGELQSDIPLSQSAAADSSDGPLVQLEVSTMSGDVRVTRARRFLAASR
jgi:hypothetical protein